ncbi:rhamnogalacturonan acetylesterase [Mucilaginibacter robiniae]|uniref:rhamnogalacturonan acetylesterase n=1 Tax=Mucilaginibacter robiniae TaxID=2728022 RepID=UPI001B7D0515|nr:rhamnogalacturonan acetylesterase [Mucilaginibacter robiniae]
MIKIPYKLLALAAIVGIWAFAAQPKPTLFLIGDSTVHNNDKVQWGWGTMIKSLFDTSRINISNNAMAGRSTRTFVKEGRWHKVDSLLKPGDFVMMQFGHNEGSVPDTTKAGYRGVLKGTGDEVKELTWPNGTHETVHSYGWYIRQFIRDVKAKHATPVVLSMIPRNEFREGKVLRADKDYGLWAREVAQQEGAYFVDLNQITADKYDQWGADSVKRFFPGDHTHTNQAGALVNAESVVAGLKANTKIDLVKYLKK